MHTASLPTPFSKAETRRLTGTHVLTFTHTVCDIGLISLSLNFILCWALGEKVTVLTEKPQLYSERL